MTESVDPAEIRRAAMYWLARRDHSRQEIHRKLQKKFGAELDTGPYLDWLEEHNFLNDARYIEVFLRSAIERGHGLLRIRQDLQQRGLDRQQVETRSAEHTSELQSRENLVCRLLLEKKKRTT